MSRRRRGEIGVSLIYLVCSVRGWGRRTWLSCYLCYGAVDGGDGGGEDPILQRLLHGTPGDPAMESRKETSEGATDRHTDTSEGLTHNPRSSRGCETRLQNADFDEKYSERNHKRASYKTFLLARESPFFLNWFLSLLGPGERCWSHSTVDKGSGGDHGITVSLFVSFQPVAPFPVHPQNGF